ncbi:hypothetical protein BVER_00554c [Candidatus Burkholderia verschuerenii]|uniref:Uncharacterized protein n=1 Tax=Candidatus Burkholderia verschuerenii TaxID=242163 RepID=A0A0L0M4N0_9BURK|nr:hypothetical protein [Candidatus Burkholderia verschuerenii]KND57251.1 hypothetical protein BVER_00554c [Candidatus Burkholderia verschuerenii]
MAYKSKFKDIFYPTGDREARVAHHRIVLCERKAIVTAVVHLRRTSSAQKHRLSRVDELGTVLNRIVDQELRGIRIDRTHLIVQQGTAFFEYPIDFNASDLPTRPTKDKPWEVPAVSMSSRDIVVGAAALFIDIDGGVASEPWIVELLQ